ncbi:zinc ribbon domain-containing protein, partial [Lapillicoccus sp.]|uniref:zinc ribbon domain-containing protein n=1 Tax=Lapillicoccus sp. TaxID=1909287 RepID=UPI0032630D28
LLFCSLCGRRMEGAWRANRALGSGRVLYRCVVKQNRALAEGRMHPSSVYVREDAILPRLDEWIESLTTAEALEGDQHPSSHNAAVDGLKLQVAGVDRKITALVAAIESGAELSQLTDQLKRRAKERDGLKAQLQALPHERPMSTDELSEAIAHLGGIGRLLSSADPVTRHQVYESLDLRLEYDPAGQRISATAGQACVFNRVRRGT